MPGGRRSRVKASRATSLSAQAAIGPRYCEAAVLEGDVLLCRLEGMRGYAAALRDDAQSRCANRGGAGRCRTGTAGPPAVINLVRIAEYYAHMLGCDAELVVEHLRKHGLQPLAVRVQAGEHESPPLHVEADLGELLQRRAGRPTGDLDGVRDADAAKQPVLSRRRATPGEAAPVRGGEDAVKVLRKRPAVVGEDETGAIRQG